MNIELLAGMIRELILKQDEVALPGLGVFVAEEVEAVFSDKGFTVNPPYRRLAFRQKESQDNSLIELYAAEKSISEEDSSIIINGFLKDFGIALKEKKSIFLPGLGHLRATRQNHFFFVQDEYAAIFPQGFGLESISLKSLSATRTVSVLKPVAEVEIVAEPETLTPSEPEAATEPEPVKEAEVVPEPQPEPEVQAAPETVIEPEPEAVTEPALETEAAVAAIPAAEPIEEQKKKRPFLTVLLVLLALVVLFLVAVAVIGRVAPQFIDPYLYTPEQLKLLNY